MLPLNVEYEATLEAVNELLADENDLIANAANLAALLFERLEAVDWTGFYFLRGGELLLGPFQGRSAKSRVVLGRGTAGRAVRDLRSIVSDERLSDDSRDDDLTQAKVVVPLLLHGRAIGVLEVTSPFAGRFGEADRQGLEAVAKAFVDGSDVLSLVPKRGAPSQVAAPPLIHTVTGENGALPAAEAPPPRRASEFNEMETVVYGSSPPPPTLVERFDDLRNDMRLRRAAIALLAVAVFIAAVRGVPGVGPGTLPALFALFTILGGVVSRGWRLSIGGTSIALAVYGALVAAARAFSGADHTLGSDAGIVIAGALGGYLGAVIARALRRRSPARHTTAARPRP